MGMALDIVSYLATLVVVYYSTLFLVSLWTTRRTPGRNRDADPFFALVIPAHDEELVIGETIARARELQSDRYVVLVMNDGSPMRSC